jgi:hypothetical protein
MKRIKQFLFTASVLAEIGAFLYAILTACAFALDAPIAWLFLCFALISLYTGLASSAWRYKLPLVGKNRWLFLAISILSTVAVLPLIFNLLAYFEKPVAEEEKRESPLEVELPKDESAKAWFRRSNVIVAAVGFLTMILASFSGQLFETSGYSVEVNDFTLTKAMTMEYNATPINGKTHVIRDKELSYSVSVYRPKTATSSAPAPTIFVMPGFTRTKATMAQYAIEYSRRGAVVFVLDPGCQGGTTYAGYAYDDQGNLTYGENGNPVQVSSTVGSNGLDYLAHYVYENQTDFPYVDRTRFGAVGHSAGGGNVVSSAAEFAGTNYQESLFKSIYVSGYIKVSAANQYKTLHCNAANAYAYYDEGSFRYQSDTTAPEVINLRFINEVAGAPGSYTSVTYDYGYGSMTEGTYRVCHREKTNHAFEMYDAESIENTIRFFRESLQMDTAVSDTSLAWYGKEISNGIALVASFAFIFAISSIGLSIPFFASLKVKKEEAVGVLETEIPANPTPNEKKSAIPARFSFSGKAILWSTTVLGAIIACLDYIPLAHLSMSWFPEAASNSYTFFFPARMFNAVLLWGAINGLIGLLLFFGVILVENLIERLVAKKQNRAPQYDWSKLKPMAISLPDLGKTLLYSLLLFALYFFMVQLCVWCFHQDFRFLLISSSPINLRMFVTWLEYIPFLFIFYISNSIKVNCSFGLEGWKEWQVYLVGALANSLGLAFILLINYTAFFVTGVPYYGYWGSDQAEVWLYVNMVFALVVMMAFLPVANRIYYRQTRKVYLGALVNVMIFVMMSIAASVSYIRL